MSGSSGRRRIRDVFAGTVRGAYDHDCADAAAAMAFDFVFAIFPAVIVLTALLSVMDIPVEAFGALLGEFDVVVPGPLIELIEENLRHSASAPQSFFALGILGVIWPASASMSTTMSALNRAYGTSEDRTVWLRRFLSIVLIISLGLALVFLFNLIVFSEQVDIWLERHWALSVEVPSLAGLLRHTAGVTGTLVAAAKLLRRRRAKRIIACVSHAVLNEQGVRRLRKSNIDELITTDSVPRSEFKGVNVTTLSVAKLLGEAIQRIHTNSSVTSLFEFEGVRIG